MTSLRLVSCCFVLQSEMPPLRKILFPPQVTSKAPWEPDLPIILHNFAASASVISLIRFFTISSRTTSAIALRAEEAVLQKGSWNAGRISKEQPAHQIIQCTIPTKRERKETDHLFVISKTICSKNPARRVISVPFSTSLTLARLRTNTQWTFLVGRGDARACWQQSKEEPVGNYRRVLVLKKAWEIWWTNHEYRPPVLFVSLDQVLSIGQT